MLGGPSADNTGAATCHPTAEGLVSIPGAQPCFVAPWERPPSVFPFQEDVRHGYFRKPLRVGLDLGKEVFQVHVVDSDGAVLEARQLKRDRLMPWCARLPGGSVVAMETCSAAHFWGRQLGDLGVEVRLIAPAFVRLTLPLKTVSLAE